MTIKQQGGVFGRNPSFNEVEANDIVVQDNGSVTVKKYFPQSDVGTVKDGLILEGIEENSNLSGGEGVGVLAKIPGNTNASYNGGRLYWERVASADTSNLTNFVVQINANSDQSETLTNALKIESNGVVTVYDNISVPSGKGIDFSATSGTGTSELFDDYEEGTWTPVLADAQTGGNTLSAAATSGFYTKTGNVVNAWCSFININTTGATAGNQVALRGLPFTVTGTDLNVRYPAAYTVAGISTSLPAFRATPNSTYALTNILVSEMISGAADIWANIIYRA